MAAKFKKETKLLKLSMFPSSGGSLRFAQNDDIQLNAENILITDGGVFEVSPRTGSSHEHFRTKRCITF